MDAEEQFWQTVRETVAALDRKNKPTQDWAADDGRVVSGWSVAHRDYPSETKGEPGRGWWRETWGQNDTILSKDGQFWEYGFSGTDEHNKETVLSRHLRETPTSYLVGSRGKPFSEMTETLERLPYR